MDTLTKTPLRRHLYGDLYGDTYTYGDLYGDTFMEMLSSLYPEAINEEPSSTD
jgi:hypothetical protein